MRTGPASTGGNLVQSIVPVQNPRAEAPKRSRARGQAMPLAQMRAHAFFDMPFEPFQYRTAIAIVEVAHPTAQHTVELLYE